MDTLRRTLAQAAGIVTWAVWRLLGDATFWTGLVATLLGVFIAFRLAGWQERRYAREQYARHLSAVRYESAQLHAICTQALAGIPQGAITSYEVEAPALRALVTGSALQEHGPHGLAVVLGSVLVFVGVYRSRFPGHQRGMSRYDSRGDRRSWSHCAIAFQG